MADTSGIARRVTVSLRAKDDENLATVTQITGLTQNDSIRKALGTEAWLQRRLAEGCTMLIRLPDGQLQEIVFIH